MKIRSVIFTMLLFGLTGSILMAQSDAPAFSNVYESNHWTFELQTSYGRTQFQSLEGNEQIEDSFDDFTVLHFGYQFNFGQNFGLQLKTGIGYRPNLTFASIRSIFIDNPPAPSIGFLQFVPFWRIGLCSDYHKQFKNSTWGFDALLGGEVAFYPNSQLRTEIGIFEEQGQQEAYFISLNYQNSPVFILDFSFGSTKVLQNNNIIGLYLVGEYHFDFMLTGTYDFQDSPSNGLMLNNGTNIGLKLKYSLTGANKREKSNRN